MNKDKLLDQFHSIIEQATEEEQQVLSDFLTAIEKKQVKQTSTYLGHIFKWERNFIDQHTLEMIMPLQPLYNNAHKIVHGGITATLLDTALGTLAAYQLPEDEGVVTTEIKINYLKPGTGKYLKCVTNLVHKGRKICVTEGKVYNDQDEIVAMATGSFYVVKMRTPKRD